MRIGILGIEIEARLQLGEQTTPMTLDQSETVRICQELRSECEDLLESPLKLTERMHPVRLFWHALLNLCDAKRKVAYNSEDFPVGDTTYVVGTIKEKWEGNPVSAIVAVTSLRQPHDADEIAVLTEEANEHLVLGKKEAHIRVHGEDDDFWLIWDRRTRNLTLQEAQRWKTRIKNFRIR